MDVPKLPSSILSASPEDLDEDGDWAPTDWTADPATKTIASYVTKWFPPGDAYGTRLHRIIRQDDADALERYLKKFHRRRVMPCVYGYPTPWHLAVQHGSLEALRVLLKYADYDYPYGREWAGREPGGAWDYCPDLRYLFFAACRSRSLPVVRFLLERSETKTETDIGQRTVPGDEMSLEEHIARCEAIIELLLDLGADVRDQRIRRGLVSGTALSYAVALGTPGLIRRLIDRGADIDVRVQFDDYEDEGIGNSTLLHIAARHLNVEAVQLLLEQPGGPAMALARDSQGRQPLHCLASETGSLRRHPALHLWQERQSVAPRAIETAKALPPHSDLEAPGPDGKTPFFLAAEYCDLAVNQESDAVRWDDVLHFLLDQGANPAVKDRHGNTALGRMVDTVRFLLDHGASPGAANDEGDTPVHMVFEKLRYLIREFRPLRDDSSEREKWEQQWIKDGEENLRRILGLFLGPAGGAAAVLDVPNRAGRTPRDMIQDVERAEKWRRNLDAECEDDPNCMTY
ncbi:hypothetical protein PG985_005314 [Apiospora marii]|uniref:uncharacterized protein n=1 Tax=Apiospora marii TaxID=335849 RepID=UPI00313115AE